MSRALVVGSRGSRLALIQAETVVSALTRANPGLSVSLRVISTSGDRNRRPFLERWEGDGIFVRELEHALLDGSIDAAVHSLKDLPTEMPEGLCLAAVPQRADPRDVLVSRGERLADLPPGARVGTGSPRRAAQLRACRPDMEVLPLRGNVDTRLKKVESGEVDAVILAAAGLVRLGCQGRIVEYLSTEQFLPAAGQGALAVETRCDDRETRDIVSSLDHSPSRASVMAERTFLREMGGGCAVPIGALGTVADGMLCLDGFVASPRGDSVLRSRVEGSVASPSEVGATLARKLLDMGASDLLKETSVQ